MDAEPLVWTTKGNLPAAALRYETAWQDGPTAVVFRERHYLGAELVKESVHVLSRTGEGADGETGSVGGGPPRAAAPDTFYVY